MVPGYYCKQKTCFRCPSGYFGTDGKVCSECPFATSSVKGSNKCSATLHHTNPGMYRTHMPFGITKINVRLWGGGGAGDASFAASYFANSGGGGGYSTCNITVRANSSIQVLVGGGAIGSVNAEIQVHTGGKRTIP